MDHTGGSSQPVQHPSAGGGAKLRQAWREGISSLGPDAELPGLRSLLDSRLTEVEQSGALDEASLLAIAEEAAQLALETGSADLARSLSRRLRRSIYEFLLALDAAPAADTPAAPVAPLEPTRPARWGQVLIGVEEVEAAQRNGDPGLRPDIDLDRVVGADDAVTAEVARAIAAAEEGDRLRAWTESEAGRLVDLADAATDDVNALRTLLEEAMAAGIPVDLPALTPGEDPPAPAYAAASAAAQAFAAVVSEARAAADATAAAEARAAAEAEAARLQAAAAERAEAMLAEIEDAEDAAARAMLLRLRVAEALPAPGVLDPDALRVPPGFRRDTPPPPKPPAPPAFALPPAARLQPSPAAAPPQLAAEPAHAPSVFPIAPREGFHLTDPSMIDQAMGGAAPAAAPAPAPAPALAPSPASPVAGPPPAPPAPAPASRWSLPVTPAPAPPPPPSGSPAAPPTMTYDPSMTPPPGGWSVRQSPRQQMLTERMAQKRREEAVRAAQEAASIAAALAEPERKRRRGRPAAPERIADVAAARDLVEQELKRKRGAEAAALLQRLAAEFPGREAADLALDSGDRCLALGQNRSATNCYLAGWRADPLYEAPLWRLADVCLTDREIALATGYLERIAELLRSRGDDAGALAVYRKIVTVAPDREDIRRLVRLAQTTGRLEI